MLWYRKPVWLSSNNNINITSWYLLTIYYVPNSVRSSFHALPHFIVPIILWDWDGLNHVPRKTKYVEVLIPNISEWGVIWNQDLCRFNQVRMRLLGWTLIQYGEIWTQTYLEGRQCKGRITWRQKFGVMHLQAKEDQRLLANHRELGRSKEGFFLQGSEGAWSWWYPDFGLLASRTVRWQISVLSHPVACGNPGKLTQVGTSSSPFHRAAASGKGGKNREGGTFSGFSTLYSWHLDQQQKENWEMVKQWESDWQHRHLINKWLLALGGFHQEEDGFLHSSPK